MPRRNNNNPYDLNAEDIGDPRKRQAARLRQYQIDQAYWDRRGGRPGTVTVTSSDNLNTIADANGTTPDALLGANPDVNQIKTGMVLNIPGSLASGFNQSTMIPSSPALPPGERGGVGLPSAGPLGSTSGYFGYQGNPGFAPISQQLKPPQTSYAPNPRAPQNWAGIANTAMASAGYTPAKNLNPLGQTIGAPATTTHVTPAAKPMAAIQYRQGEAWRTQETYANLRNKIDMGATPTQEELDWLVRFGKLKKTAQPSFSGGGGGGFSGRRRGGGGGGGKAGAPKAPKESGLPAFSNGAGFGGLVNWRI